MTKEEEKQLHEFEALVRRLMSAYKSLRAENASLKSALEQCRQQLADTEKCVEAARKDYETLKTARMIEVSSGDIKDSRQRLAKIIREVDKCIALLDV